MQWQNLTNLQIMRELRSFKGLIYKAGNSMTDGRCTLFQIVCRNIVYLSDYLISSAEVSDDCLSSSLHVSEIGTSFPQLQPHGERLPSWRFLSKLF